LSKVLT